MAKMALMYTRQSWASAPALPPRSYADSGPQGLGFLMCKERTVASVGTMAGLSC